MVASVWHIGQEFYKFSGENLNVSHVMDHTKRVNM